MSIYPDRFQISGLTPLGMRTPLTGIMRMDPSTSYLLGLKHTINHTESTTYVVGHI